MALDLRGCLSFASQKSKRHRFSGGLVLFFSPSGELYFCIGVSDGCGIQCEKNPSKKQDQPLYLTKVNEAWQTKTKSLKREREWIHWTCSYPVPALQSCVDNFVEKKKKAAAEALLPSMLPIPMHACIHWELRIWSLWEVKHRLKQKTLLKPCLFFSLASLCGVSASYYNPALEKRGPVKQHKRIGAQIPLD